MGTVLAIFVGYATSLLAADARKSSATAQPLSRLSSSTVRTVQA